MEPLYYDIWRYKTFIGNLYLVRDGGSSVLIDAGVPKLGRKIADAIARIPDNPPRPEAILLTHGHFDHAGSVTELVRKWNVPVFAHRLEFPYLQGRSKYPPTDPTVGGFYAFASRFMPNPALPIDADLRRLPDDGSVPFLPSWKWIATPGHTPGHVSFFRSADSVLIAGDAVITTNMDSAMATIFQEQVVSRPPASVTTNWQQTEASTLLLSQLSPFLLAAGHGEPMHGEEMRRQLEHLAAHYPKPSYGRYANQGAIADENGVAFVPDPVPDPMKRVAIGAAVALMAGWLLGAAIRNKRARD